MKPVKKLPIEVCSLVRSGVVIPTPTQAVMELVLNSIDAGATSVAVRVDLRLFKIQVIDNGHGIMFEDLETIGNRSVTSKCYTLDEFYNNLMYHGYRGESLASLREMCGLLEIMTRTSDCNKTYSKLFIHGKEGDVKESDLTRPAHGTTITITDFMFNMPVRRERMKEVVELEAIRSCIECVALAHPEISISVRNDAKGRIILEKHKSSDLLKAFEHLFGHNLARSMAAINFSTEKFKINGYISKEAYRHNDMQFIYVNRQPIMKTKLHKLASVLLAKSSILRTNGPWKSKPIPKKFPVERWLSFPSLEKNKKFAVFVINITCARKEYEMCWDTKKPLIYFKDWEGIVDCVSNAIQDFLKKENLVDDEDEDCHNSVVEDNTKNYPSTSHQRQPHSSNGTYPHETASKNDQQIDYEVETWNIHGAVHGVCAKRPKEKKEKQECKYDNNKICEAKDDLEYGEHIERRFLTPDSINSNFQYEQDSVPPVVKFVEKYGTPAVRLNITKGAYRLKKMEEEQKKVKIAAKLGQFKLAGKPKLCAMEKKKNIQKGVSSCAKLLSNEKIRNQISMKLETKDIVKEKKLSNKEASELYNSNASNNSSEWEDNHQGLTQSECKLRNSFVDKNLIDDKNQGFMDCNSSLETETENVSVSLCSPAANDFTKNSNLELSDVSTAIYEQELSNDNRNHNLNEGIFEKSFRGPPPIALHGVNEPNVQSYNNITTSAELFKHPINSEKNRNVLHPDERISVHKCGSWNLHPIAIENYQKNENHIKSSNNENFKPRRNLEVSEIMVVSIPTPKPIVNRPVSSTSVSMDDQLNLSSYREKQVSASERNDPCINELPMHNSQTHEPKLNELFVFSPKECTESTGHNEVNAMKLISSPLVFNPIDQKLKKIDRTLIKPESHETASTHPVSNENNAKRKLHTSNMEQQSNFIKSPSTTSRVQKIQNLGNIFETFEKNMVFDSLKGSRSPYFTPKNNSESSKQTLKSSDLEYGKNSDKKEESDRNNKAYETSSSNTRKNNDKILSLFQTSETDQKKELFPGLPDSSDKIGKEINVHYNSCDFSFTPYGLVKDSRTSSFEQMNAQKEFNFTQAFPTSPKTGAPEVQSSLLPLDQTENIVSEKTCISKKRLLSQNKCKEVVEQTERVISEEDEETEEFAKRKKPFKTKTCMISAEDCQNINILKEKSTNLQKKELFQMETGETSSERVLDEDWLQLKNFEGKLFYFHVPSGFTSYNTPSITKDASLYPMSKRFQFLPKGMSPLLAAASTTVPSSSVTQSNLHETSADISEWTGGFTSKIDLNTVKWREKPNIFNDDISDVLNIAKALPDKKTLSSNTSIPDLSFISAKMSGLLLQQKFDKRIFTNIQVVSQLDNKFIITLCSLDKNSCPHILGIFDQHAVHERIRLEMLMKEYSNGEDEFTATDLHEPIVLTVSSKEFHVMSNFQSKFEKLGLHIALMDKDNNIEVHRIPTCLHTRSLRERSRQWLEATLRILIQDVVFFLIKTGGQDCVVPEVFKDVINSEACKGAIKFGDPLSVIECENLLSMLSKCDLPFYCAHGRPSFMPILDLRQFEVERRKYVPDN